MIILGIDPGYERTGFGVIEYDKGKSSCLDYGVIKTDKGLEFVQRLQELHQDLKKIIQKYKPGLIAVEDLFFYKNVKTAIKVGQARGVVLLTCTMAGIKVCEYTPLQVKQGVCGYGKADKKQIQTVVKMLLKLDKLPQPDDAADALAVAICTSGNLAMRC